MNGLDVKRIRKELGLTQLEFAKKIGVSRDTVINYERGETIPLSKVEMLNNLQLKMHESTSDEITGFYYPDVAASAGMNQELNNDDLKKIPVTIPGWEKDVVFINVFGDSMYPKYNAGEIIGVKPLDFKYIVYGHAYVVVLTNGDTYIKIIQPGKDEDHLLFVSANDFYKPKEFHLSLIKAFYSIKGVIKKEMM